MGSAITVSPHLQTFRNVTKLQMSCIVLRTRTEILWTRMSVYYTVTWYPKFGSATIEFSVKTWLLLWGLSNKYFLVVCLDLKCMYYVSIHVSCAWDWKINVRMYCWRHLKNYLTLQINWKWSIFYQWPSFGRTKHIICIVPLYLFYYPCIFALFLLLLSNMRFWSLDNP